MRFGARSLLSATSSSILLAAIFLMVALRSEARAESDIRIIISKNKHQLWVLRNDRMIRRYPISLGKQPIGAKETRGDGRTPVGVYYVYEKRPSSRYDRFLALNYPAAEDAERALHAGKINPDTWADIWLASMRHEEPPWNTLLGGFVGIHGTGGQGRQAELRRMFDWTDGCVALSDHDVEELYDLTPVGASVEIYE